MRFYYSYGTALFAEAHLLPHPSPDSVRILSLFRIVHDVLPFTQKGNPENEEFSADVIVEIEIKDSEGIIRERANWRKEITVDSYESTNSKKDYIFGVEEVAAKAGRYDLEFTLLSENGRRLARKTVRTETSGTYFKEPVISKPVFVNRTGENTLRPFIIENNISFRAKQPAIILNISYKKGSVKAYRYEITRLETEDRILQWNNDFQLSGLAEFEKDAFIDIPDRRLSNSLFLNIRENFEYRRLSGLRTGLLIIRLPENKIVPGKYRLSIKGREESDTLTYDFEVKWENMPLSLRSISYLRSADYAIDLMFYLLNEEEYDEMNSGSDSERFLKLLEYWKQHDPTPDTPYNEAMAEYFHRADYAYYNFKTLTVKDGAFTDRGKIYMLYGAPDKIENELGQKKSSEIWWYERLKKEFVFEIVSTGKYKLETINEL